MKGLDRKGIGVYIHGVGDPMINYLNSAHNFLFYARKWAQTRARADGTEVRLLEIEGKKISLVAHVGTPKYGSSHDMWYAFIVLNADTVRVVRGTFAVRTNSQYWTGWIVEDLSTDKARIQYREVAKNASWKKTVTGHVSGIRNFK